MKTLRFKSFLFSLIALSASFAQANVGIPVVALGLPFMLANLIFVVFIEFFVLKRFLKTFTDKQLFWAIFKANLVTTLIGYPVVAILEALSPLVGLNLGWLLPFQNLETHYSYISLVVTLTLVPCFFVSVWIERKLLKKWLATKLTWKSMFYCHLASYAFLILQVYTHFPIKLLNYGQYTFEYAYVAVMAILGPLTN